MSLGAILTGLGHALVSHGFGGPGDTEPTNEPCAIYMREFVPLTQISVMPMSKILVGSVAVCVRLEFRSSKTGALVDPDGITIQVRPPSGDDFELAYLVTPTDGVEDAITRDAEGKYSVQIDATAARGAGDYEYVLTSTGAKGVQEGTFHVYATII